MFESLILKNGVVLTVDFANKAFCKKCKAPIIWAVTKRAKNIPICKDESGQWIAHFANCAYADSFRTDLKKGDTLDSINRQKERDEWLGER